MMIDTEWYIFFQSLWVQNIMALIFAMIFFVILCFEMLTKDAPLIVCQRPPDEAFYSDSSSLK